MFSKILIANRGEIAVRIIRACKEMGILTVAVYSEADKNSLHTALADERVCIGKSNAQDSYLNIKNIISAAIATNANAIHPGYGFLSENSFFAKECENYGIAFIGPDAEIIKKMGDKNNARRLMKKNNIPIIGGSEIIKNVEELKETANKISYPLLIKASAGGGGKGIRLVESEENLEREFFTAKAEAQKAFGNDDCYLEKYLLNVRHIEVQILADNFGNVVSLGERDCSLQKRKQKQIEEAPSPKIDESLRKKLQETAIRAAVAAKYKNVGTIEFLLDKNNDFYFLEMNTRLQVEHPITEEITDIDIVKWQIRLASCMPLNFKQEDIVINGSAIECRICAKSCGTIEFFHAPCGRNVHFASYLIAGCEVVPFYDSMIGKLIVRGKTREEAIRKAESALCELVISGVETNIDDQLKIIRSEVFNNGEYDTEFLEKWQ